jgi:secreted PhoX family phosphatase
MNRRQFFLLMGISASTVTMISACQNRGNQSSQIPLGNISPSPDPNLTPNIKPSVKFSPIQGPMPLPLENLSAEQQIANYANYQVIDDLVLPQDFQYQVIASWGDPVGQSRFGYNNDYLSFLPTGDQQGLLTVNFEYISAIPWIQSYQEVIDESLPFDTVINGLKKQGKAGIDVGKLKKSDSLRKALTKIAIAAMTDMGIGVIAIKQDEQGKWLRTNSNLDRRVTGLSGWQDSKYLKATGPATAIFKKPGKGYNDQLGNRIIGTFANCAGGTSPWGTVFSAEENFQAHVIEDVYPDGSAYNPREQNVFMDDEEIGGIGAIFGLAGNKYGWMVEIDPANPDDYGTKHTWIGRYRHEAVAIRAEAGKKLAFYSGCDRRGGHLYKFVSRDLVKNPQDKKNSQLLNDGMLYAAKFNPDGTGVWLPLKADTAVNPDLPSVHAGGLINLPKRPEGGVLKVEKDEDIATYKKQYKTLADLYTGNPTGQQGAILIDAHLAANAVGATCTARPEDTDMEPNGDVFIAFTSGSPSNKDGGPNLQIFHNNGQPYEYGWIMRLSEDNNDPGANAFRWQMFATGGEPAEDGLGFVNPDNLEFDQKGNVWMVTDISNSKLNKAVPAGRTQITAGQAVDQNQLGGLFGNNSFWCIPTSGDDAGIAYLFAMGPMECEITGPFFTPDQKTLFAAIQHPGALNGIRKDQQQETRQIAMTTTDGQEFLQTRQVPIGSNWPGKQVNNPPKPAVVAIYRQNRESII